MKILFVGNFTTNWSTNHPMVKGLKEKNHHVMKFDFRGLAKKNARIKSSLYTETFFLYFDSLIRPRLYLPDIIRNIKYYIFGNYRMNQQLLSTVRNNDFDIILLAKTDTVNYKILKKLKQYSKIWYYFMDPLRVAFQINAYKYAKLADWSSASTIIMNHFFLSHGANSHYITQGFNSDLFKPGKENEDKNIDVIFAGKANAKRKKYINFLLKKKINVICYGKGWSNGPIYMEELAKKYRHSRIILNFLRLKSGFSIRIFQAMGTGSLLLSEYCPDLGEIFRKGVHLDWFENPEESYNMIKYYLKNEIKREEIAKEGYLFVNKNYSWDKIMERIIKIIENKPRN
ncbi:MAG: glycosyltransferase [Promethearchaeota archaeon]